MSIIVHGCWYWRLCQCWCWNGADDKRRVFKDSLLVLASGAFLALHFSCWVWVSATMPCHHGTALRPIIIYSSSQKISVACVTPNTPAHQRSVQNLALYLQSIHHTSLTHALLYGSTAPVLIAMGTLIIRKPISTGKLSCRLPATGLDLCCICSSAHRQKHLCKLHPRVSNNI